MLIEGFDRLDTSMTIYNYPYYPKFLEACGYEKEVDWVEFLLKPSEATTKSLHALPRMSRRHTAFR